jgi:hypothetical protein
MLWAFGTDYLDAAPLLQIMAPVYVLGGLSHFALKQGLMVLRGDRCICVVVVGVGLGSLLINYLLIRALDLTGPAWAKVLIELALGLCRPGWPFGLGSHEKRRRRASGLRI